LYDTQNTALSSYPKNLNISYCTLAMAEIPVLMTMRHTHMFNIPATIWYKYYNLRCNCMHCIWSVYKMLLNFE